MSARVTEVPAGIRIGPVTPHCELAVPERCEGLTILAHGSGSSRMSPRNRAVAEVFRGAHPGTLLFDLLTEEEEARDALTRELRFDIALLARLATDWFVRHLADLPRARRSSASVTYQAPSGAP